MSTPVASTSAISYNRTRSWPPRLYLAVDCGGTKSAAAICDENGRLIGKGRGGPSNFTDEGLHPFLSSVADAVKDALDSVRRNLADLDTKSASQTWRYSTEDAPPEQDANINESSESSKRELDLRTSISEALGLMKPPGVLSEAIDAKFEAAWFGIAGVDSPADVTQLSPHLARLLNIPFPSARLIVANDTSLLASPITDSTRPGILSGVVVIAGTGSIVVSYKRSKNGMLQVLGRVGGFGWLLGDEGSGYSVGRAAVRKILDLADQARLAREQGDGTDSEEERDVSVRPSASGYCGSASGDADSTIGMMAREGIHKKRPLCEEANTSSLNTIAVPGASKRSEDSADGFFNSQAEEMKAQPPYAQLLRDRILQDWGLESTDELLRAVYFDDNASSRPLFGGEVPRIVRPTSLAEDHGKLSAPPLRGYNTNSLSPLAQADPTLSLLPPTGLKLDDEVRGQGHSPIPSLSSSPSDSGCTAIVSGEGQRPTSITQSDSAAATEGSSAASSFSVHEPTSPRSSSDRKHRLASLAPLVFHLAFSHGDRLCLDILREQAHFIALQIRIILQPSKRAKAYLCSQGSVLCLGGGLVGQLRYRHILLEELQKLGIVFSAVEYVSDPATRGAMALSSVIEQRSADAKSHDA